MSPSETLDYLKKRGCKIGGVTMGERGMLWYDEIGRIDTMAALPVPASRIVDTSGAGDVFHGAYIYSFLSKPGQAWQAHFDFARTASAFKIQHLGNEAGLPTLQDIASVTSELAAHLDPRPERSKIAVIRARR
jgi:sugar/nucleoside kinase (ribokinase family)